MLKKILLLSIATVISTQIVPASGASWATTQPSIDLNDVLDGLHKATKQLTEYGTTKTIQLDERTRKIEELQEEVRYLQAALSSSTAAGISLSQQLTDTHLAGLKSIADLQDSLNQTHTAKLDLIKALNEKELEIQKLQHEILQFSTAQTSLQAAQSSLKTLEQDRDAWKTRHDTAQADLTKAQSELSLAKSEAAKLTTEITQLNADLANARSTHSGSIATIQAQLMQKETDLKKAQDEVNQNNQLIIQNTKSLNALQSKHDAIQAKHDALVSELATEQAKSLSFDTQIKTLTKDLSDAQTHGSTQASSLQAQLANLKTVKAELDNKITEHTTKISQLESNIAGHTSKYATLEAAHTQLQGTHKTAQEELDKIEKLAREKIDKLYLNVGEDGSPAELAIEALAVKAETLDAVEKSLNETGLSVLGGDAELLYGKPKEILGALITEIKRLKKQATTSARSHSGEHMWTEDMDGKK